MSDKSNIEWTDATWPVVVGCDRVSPGCANCYAVKDGWRMGHNPNPKVSAVYGGLVERQPNGHLDWTGVVRCVEERLDWPLKWKQPRRIFVCSQSDLFHEDVPDAFLDRVFAVMALAPQHTFQVLTKRAERMRSYLDGLDNEDAWEQRLEVAMGEFLDGDWIHGDGQRFRSHIEGGISALLGVDFSADGEEEQALYEIQWPLVNVWLGVSVENQHFADERIPLLLQAPAAVRFISAEPLLGPIDLQKVCAPLCPQCHGSGEVQHSDEGGIWTGCPCERLTGLSWVIVGGESGHGARPFDLAWARSIVRQCQAAGVACFVKQLGSNPNYQRPRATLAAGAGVECEHGYDVCPTCDAGTVPLRSKKGGDMAEWPEDLRVRQFPEVRP